MSEPEQLSRFSHDYRPPIGQGYFDRSYWVKVLIGLLFTLCLIFFLHFRQVKFEKLELGGTAGQYVVAQLDFTFPDEEATAVRKDQAVRDIGAIFRLDERGITNRQAAFERALNQNKSWREKVGDATFDEMYLGIDQLSNMLRSARFADPRTVKKMAKEGFDTSSFYLFTPSNVEKPTTLPIDIWNQLGAEAFVGTGLSPEAITFILAGFEKRKWMLIKDVVLIKQVQRDMRKRVPKVKTEVKAGSRLIDKGEPVTTRHVAMLQAMNKARLEQRNLWHPMTVVGTILLALLFVTISAGYLRMYLPSIFYSNKKVFLLAIIAILTLGIAKGCEYLILKTNQLSDYIDYPLFVPFAAIVICSLLNARVAAFSTAFLAVVMSLTLAFDRAGFLVINLLAGLVAVLGTRRLRKRKEVFTVCAKAWICAVIVLIAFHAYDNTLFKLTFVTDLGFSFIFMLLTAVLVVGLLPVFESLFRIVTEITLMEFMDPTHPLLRRLSIEAPGTYQHSIVVGNLAEAAATAIGANGLFCRVSTLYHDIGKLNNPQYFTENQQGEVDIHQLLTPLESAQVIMNHVPEGAVLARKHGLPDSFIDIIKSHHGTTLVYFFYHKACEREGAENIKEKDYRYHGPKPHSKESAIIMIADTLEAASRSLDHPNEEAITQLVEHLVGEKADDRQFDECLLTFEDFQIVKLSIVKSLAAALHSRIKYPPKSPPPLTAMPAEEA